jgi:hypothetical protein
MSEWVLHKHSSLVTEVGIAHFHGPFPQLEVSETIALKEYYSEALYLRVLASNEPARAMYTNLGYNIIQNPGEPPQILLLQGKLTAS